nr:hypothetical protein [Tanacetum cinerariifolium]
MKRYYRDWKEMFDATRDLEECEDVLETDGDENYNVMRNEVEGPGGKIVDEFIYKECTGKSGKRNRWIKEMKRYYRDWKEMFDATRDLEECEDVLETDGDENYNVMRNEVEGPGGSFN